MVLHSAGPPRRKENSRGKRPGIVLIWTALRLAGPPQKKGEFNFKLEKVTEDGAGKVTTSSVTSFNINQFQIPFGITYAVFGSNVTKGAKFQFRDGSGRNILFKILFKWFQFS